MNILIINTASINSEINLIYNDKKVVEKLCDSHSEHLLPTIDNILNNNNLSLKEVDCFGINLGPGSFTGIRIGVSTIKGFLFNSNKKCVTFNSFEPLAYNIKDTSFIALLNSGNNDFYYAVYENGILKEMSYSNLSEIKSLAYKKNLKIYASILEKGLICDGLINYIEIKEHSLINLVLDKCNKNDFCAINNLCPIYIKRSQAEIGLDERIKKGLSIEKLNNYLQLISIENECFQNGWTEDIFKEEFEQKDRHYYVAKVDDEYVGYISLWQTGDDLNILKLAVLPRFRKLGIATKLIERAKTLLQELELNQLFLEVDVENNKAIALYKKNGFVTKNVRKNYYKNGNDCNVMFLESKYEKNNK